MCMWTQVYYIRAFKQIKPKGLSETKKQQPLIRADIFNRLS